MFKIYFSHIACCRGPDHHRSCIAPFLLPHDSQGRCQRKLYNVIYSTALCQNPPWFVFLTSAFQADLLNVETHPCVLSLYHFLLLNSLCMQRPTILGTASFILIIFYWKHYYHGAICLSEYTRPKFPDSYRML